EALASTKAAVTALFAKYQLDAIVYPTSPRPALYIKPDGLPAPTDSPTNLANESGFPDLIVPAGMSWSGLPVTISFFGQAFSEGQLLAYGYDFEQARPKRGYYPSTRPRYRAMCWGWLQPGTRRKHAAPSHNGSGTSGSRASWALWKKRLELQPHSR